MARAVQSCSRMKKKSRSAITHTYDTFVRVMARLGRARACDCELPGLTFFVGDAVHHLCAVLADLEELEHGDRTAPHTAHDQMTDVQVALAREAYLSVLSIGQALRTEAGMSFTAPDVLATGKAAVARMLDALAPYVSASAETNLRRIVIDGVDPEAIWMRKPGDASGPC